jgi:agmatinase
MGPMRSEEMNRMSLPLTVPPKQGHKSFLYSEVVTDLDRLEAGVAFLGIPHGDPYSMEDVNNDQRRAPTAVRQASDRAVRSLERYDFDVGDPIYAGKKIRVVDGGDVLGNMHDFIEHRPRAETAVRRILAAGALPIIIGGDHAIPISVLHAYEGRGPITLVQIHAHRRSPRRGSS